MGTYVDPGNGGYSSIRSSPYFVDKSGLLQITNQKIGGDKRFFCVCRPRRFGKTLAAEMLTSYYSCGCESASLFDGLAVSETPEYHTHLNQHHVIRFSMLSMDVLLQERQKKQRRSQRSKGPDWLSMSVSDYLDFVISRELQEAFPQCFDPEGSMMEILNDIYRNHEDHPQFIIVIDEWDHIFRKYADRTDLQEEYITFLTSLFKSDLTCDCIPLAYMTGIYPIKKYGLQSTLNVFEEFTMVDPLSLEEYTGFTENEVANLCSRNGLSLEDMKIWYDGYRFGGNFSVYCPASVASAVEYGKLRSFWPHTESYDDVRNYINMDIIGLRPAIAQLLRGEPLTCATDQFSNDIGQPKTRDELLTMLIHLGYLTCVETVDNRSKVAIPNQEIRYQFEQNTKDEQWLRIFGILDSSAALLRNTWAGKADRVAAAMERVHFELTATQNYNSEEALRCVVLTAYQAANAFYEFHVEPSMGFGRADIFFEPLLLPGTAPAIPILVELKWNQSAESAIEQIKDRQYVRPLSRWPDVLLVGINYDPGSREHTCIIEHYHPGGPDADGQ